MSKKKEVIHQTPNNVAAQDVINLAVMMLAECYDVIMDGRKKAGQPTDGKYSSLKIRCKSKAGREILVSIAIYKDLDQTAEVIQFPETADNNNNNNPDGAA